MFRCLGRSVAKVYYTISNLASDNQKAQIGLEKATGTIKRELGHNLKLYKNDSDLLSRRIYRVWKTRLNEMLRNLERIKKEGNPFLLLFKHDDRLISFQPS